MKVAAATMATRAIDETAPTQHLCFVAMSSACNTVLLYRGLVRRLSGLSSIRLGGTLWNSAMAFALSLPPTGILRRLLKTFSTVLLYAAH